MCVYEVFFSIVYPKMLFVMYALHFVFKITRIHEKDFYFFFVHHLYFFEIENKSVTNLFLNRCVKKAIYGMYFLFF